MRSPQPQDGMSLPRRRSSRRRGGHIESLLLVMCIWIILCVAGFAFEISRREGYTPPHTMLALLVAQLGFWVGLFALIGLATVIVKFFQPKVRLYDLFAGCVILGIFGAWVLITIVAVVGIVWELIIWLLR